MLKVMVILFIDDQLLAKEREKLIQLFLPECSVVVVTGVDEVKQHLTDADIIVSTAMFPIGRSHMEKAERLRFIQILGVGTDHVDLDAARELGITVANVDGANAVSVAEHVLMSALALLRDLANTHESMKQGEWPFSVWAGRAQELAGKTVGIMGMGRIGKAVAERFSAFDVSLLYYARSELRLSDMSKGRQADFSTLLAQSDILTVHLPLTPETHELLNRERLFKMKRGAFVINTSRAGLVEETALIEALSSHLGGAALDVFHQEPLPADNKLRKLPNVLLTPHGAGVTIEAQNRIAQGAVFNIRRFIAGERLADVKITGK
ncbi:MAG: 2-hydroxyacid dehydrogenase [Dethiobacter sp.]|jgi:formate dehydrogenase|nr:2-hydroxyacid dehydrogenase [Dethiobacter sp.]